MIRTVALSMLILLTGTSILFAQDDSSECIDRNQISESFNSQIFGLEQWRWLGIGVSFSARVIWNSGSNRSNNLAPVEMIQNRWIGRVPRPALNSVQHPLGDELQEIIGSIDVYPVPCTLEDLDPDSPGLLHLQIFQPIP